MRFAGRDLIREASLKYVITAGSIVVLTSIFYCVWSFQNCSKAIGNTDNMGATTEIACPGMAPTVGGKILQVFRAD